MSNVPKDNGEYHDDHNLLSRREFIKGTAILVGAAVVAQNLPIREAWASTNKTEILGTEPPYTVKNYHGYEYTINDPFADRSRPGSVAGSPDTFYIPGPHSDPGLKPGYNLHTVDSNGNTVNYKNANHSMELKFHPSGEHPEIVDDPFYGAKTIAEAELPFITAMNGDYSLLEKYNNYNSSGAYKGYEILSIEKLPPSRAGKNSYLVMRKNPDPLGRGDDRYSSYVNVFDEQKRRKIVITLEYYGTPPEINPQDPNNLYANQGLWSEYSLDNISEYARQKYIDLVRSLDYWDGTEPREMEPKIGHYLYQPEYLNCAPVDLEFKWPTGFDWLKSHPEESRKAGMALSAAAYQYQTEEVLKSLGLEDIENWDESNCKYFTNNNNLTFTLAHQPLDDGTELICVVARGTEGRMYPMSPQWLSNILGGLSSMSSGDYHHGFAGAAIGLEKQLQDYIDALKSRGVDENKMRIYFTGHSRGGAAINIVAEAHEKMRPGKVLADTFATPNTSWRQNTSASGSIRNYVNTDDIVPVIVLGGSKAGATYGYNPNPEQVKAFYCVNNLTDNSIVNNHMPEDLVAKVYGTNTPNTKWTGSKWLEVGLHCPVNAEIYDGSKLVAKSEGDTSDDDAWFDTTAGVLATEFESEKLFYLPADREYTLKIVATGAGEATYSVLQSDGSEAPIEIVKSQTIPVEYGDEKGTLVGEEFVLFEEEPGGDDLISGAYEVKISPYVAAGGAVALAAGAAAVATGVWHHNKKQKQDEDEEKIA